MNKLILTVAGLLLTATTAFADSSVQVLNVIDNYNNRTLYTRNPVNKCTTVDVPIYSRQKQNSAGANALGGMIVGGLLGKALGGDGNGAAAGAILGGVIGADKTKPQRKEVIGYQRQEKCTTTYVETKEFVSDYLNTTIKFRYEGNVYTMEFVK